MFVAFFQRKPRFVLRFESCWRPWKLLEPLEALKPRCFSCLEASGGALGASVAQLEVARPPRKRQNLYFSDVFHVSVDKNLDFSRVSSPLGVPWASPDLSESAKASRFLVFYGVLCCVHAVFSCFMLFLAVFSMFSHPSPYAKARRSEGLKCAAKAFV